MRTWARLVRTEWRTIFSDQRIFILMLGGPFFYACLFGPVYLYGRVRKIPTVIVDQDHSALSRELCLAVNSSDSLHVTEYGETQDDFAEAAKRGDAYLCLLIPRDFERDLKHGHQAKVVVIVEGSNILIGNTTYRAIRTILGTFRVQARAKRLLASGVPRDIVITQANPVTAAVRSLYNPTSSYNFFMLMGTVCIALQRVTMMGGAISLGLTREKGLWAKYTAISQSPLVVLLGKASAHAFIMVPLALIGISLPFVVFGAPYRGSWELLYAVTALFIVIHVFVGMGMTSIFRGTLLTLEVILSLSVPIFFLTGFVWPAEAMPAWMQVLSSLHPLSHYTAFVRRASLIGASYDLLRPEVLAIAASLPVAFTWAYVGVRSFMREASREQV